MESPYVTFGLGVDFHGCNSIIDSDIQVWKLKFFYTVIIGQDCSRAMNI
mgnify:CR=1 FL=1